VGAEGRSAFAMIGPLPPSFTRSTINSALALLPAAALMRAPKLASVALAYISPPTRVYRHADDFVNETIEANGDFLVGKGLGCARRRRVARWVNFSAFIPVLRKRRWLGDRSCRVITPVVPTKNGSPLNLFRVASTRP